MANNLRSKNMMYVQDLTHLPFDSLESLFTHIEETIKPKRIAGILHDKDVKKDGTSKNDHIHIMMTFKNARSIKQIAKLIGDKPEFIEKWSSQSENGFSYLIHATENASNQFQYDPDEVIANFNYIELLETIKENIKQSSHQKKKNRKNEINELLDALLGNKISKEKLENMLTASELANNSRRIDIIEEKRLKKNALIWKEKMEYEKRKIKTIWIYGSAGVGKTHLAKKIARKVVNKENDSFFIAGSSRDPFQDYIDEHIVILDELRPSVFDYSDLLKMFDPYNIDNSAPSRYKDKNLVVHTFIITTPYSPKEFYENILLHNKKKMDSKIDTFLQLARRLEEVIHLTDRGGKYLIYDKNIDNFKLK